MTRLKRNTRLDYVADLAPGDAGPIVSDRIAYLPERMAHSRQNPFRDPLREIVVAVDNARTLRLVTNDLDSPACEIAALYKERWQIELFFKWIKQNLKIKRFLGTSENAVRIQIYVALIAYLLLHLARRAQHAIPSATGFAKLVGLNLMHRRSLDRLLEPPPTLQINTNQLVLTLT